MKYVEVVVGVERHWKNTSFTYSTLEDISPGQLVRVPFGKKKKVGLVIKSVSKPSFETKPIFEVLPAKLSRETSIYMKWLQHFYALSEGESAALFLPSYISTAKKISQPEKFHKDKQSVNLSSAQKTAIEEILETPKPTVLQGITGSGKTRIYIELINRTLSSGKNALLLYPEIALTTQLVNELQKYATVLTFHSHLSPKERSDLWLQVAMNDKPVIIAGPRSALLLPHKNLGIIIVDEAHETSYKQESDVRYSGLLAAGGLAKAHNAKLLLGSATPPITETELIVNSGGSLVRLNEKAIQSNHQKNTTVIDLKNSKSFKKHPLLSDKLLDSIQASLDARSQTLLFLNRRGTAKLLLCESCGWQAECPNCELPMTYHHDNHKTICHTCGFNKPAPSTCPECQNETTMKSLGSKALVEEITKLFPEAKIARFDSDTSKSESFTARYDEITKGDVDILIGTQQLAKGIDLPKLRTVGVLQADLSLHFPDYSSNERTFQLLSQVLGRVGRGHGKSEVFLQSYQPDNPVIQLALTEDWQNFRERELIERKKHNFPPSVFIAKLLAREKSFEAAYASAQKARKKIESKKIDVQVDGPIPSFYTKRGGYYYVQLHLRSKQRAPLIEACNVVRSSLIIDLDPITLL